MSARGGGLWLALIGCAALIAAAMVWLTLEVVEAERQRRLADARADLEERVRLSLWRMDSTGAALMVEENQRAPGVVAGPPNPLVRERFRVGREGVLLASGGAMPSEALRAAVGELGTADERFRMFCSAVELGEVAWAANRVADENSVDAKGPRQSVVYQQALNRKERAVRGGALNEVVGKLGISQAQAEAVSESGLRAFEMFHPVWIEDELFLLRAWRDPAGGLAAIEGAWLDAVALRGSLLRDVGDLLPAAALVPTEAGSADPLTLASLPWRLDPGEVAMPVAGVPSTLVGSLVVGWVAAIVAMLAAAALIAGVVRLSERRAAFVSAVTHELRTPLTTFQLYSGLLAEGRVRDEGKRHGYYRTLRRESDRLAHLVENVLSYSRLERGREAARGMRSVAIDELLEGMREELEERLAGAGLSLALELEPGVVAHADPEAVERIVFNLVDNAAKYAGESEPARVELRARSVAGRVAIEVRDHGPGVASAERRRIFRPFHKSAAAAAVTAPGVGLGLALSRRLARSMGGELDLRAGGEGACFVLQLAAGGG